MLHSIVSMRGRSLRSKPKMVRSAWWKISISTTDTWAIRYLVVDTSPWLGGRSVLISPIALGAKAWASDRLTVALTGKQVENSPLSILIGRSRGKRKPPSQRITVTHTIGAGADYGAQAPIQFTLPSHKRTTWGCVAPAPNH